MKNMFFRHEISDYFTGIRHWPQYFATEFSKFAKKYRFTHATSRPQFPQTYDTAEGAIQTIQMLKKVINSMLTYRSSPQHSQYSPAELLMRLKTTIVTHSDNLQPSLPNHGAFKTRNHAYKIRMNENHNDN